MLGMGSGQPNRVESLRIAMRKAGDEVKGAALASDAFFPFGKCYCHIKYLQYRNSLCFVCVMNNTFSGVLGILSDAYILWRQIKPRQY